MAEMATRRAVLVVGDGGREQALAWKLAKSDNVDCVFLVNGNAGTWKNTKNVTEVDVGDAESVASWCSRENVGLIVVGPEMPLAHGFVDNMHNTAPSLLCFGPTKQAATLESSKVWAKSFMHKYGLPTARYAAFTDADQACKHIQSAEYEALVVKASALCAGKGVTVARDRHEACQAAVALLKDKTLGSAGDEIVVEELLKGQEVSALCFTDGKTIRLMPLAQDHKQLLEGDKGPNTGGMGAFAPFPLVDSRTLHLIEQLLQKTIDCLRNEEKIIYKGILYAGLMLTDNGPMLLEFNCRFGDPETQVLLPLLKTDLYDICVACVEGTLAQMSVEWSDDKVACGIVLVSEGYPGHYKKGKVITDIPDEAPDAVVFHAGTRMEGNRELTNGGRVLCATAIASDLKTARERALRLAESIHFEGKRFRRDIGYRVLSRSCDRTVTYAEAGVCIDEGERLVGAIRAVCKKTQLSCPGASGIGGFGAVFDLRLAGFSGTAPVLVFGMDGVGTKLDVAERMGQFSSIGVDLVAMCVNDVLCEGAKPIAFLDYYVTGKLNADHAKSVIEGIADGCLQAGCALVGGETAEMPGVYGPNQWDVAGCAIGARDWLSLPRIDDICENDLVLGIASSGLHSNGFSLVRRIITKRNLKYNDPCPWDSSVKTIGDSLLTPTKIYIHSLLELVKSGRLKALAHITGGGLTENIPRVLPDSCGAQLNAASWNIPNVFKWLYRAGPMSEKELLRTFNCGIGMVAIVSKEEVAEVTRQIREKNEVVYEIGRVTKLNHGSSDRDRVQVCNLSTSLISDNDTHAFNGHNAKNVEKIKVGILISGSGTNMEALIQQSLREDSVCHVAVVISSKESAGGLAIARSYGVNALAIRCVGKSDAEREKYEAEIDECLRASGVQLVCLAGFMRILTKSFVEKWRGAMLNTHPSLLPAFKGHDAVDQALKLAVRVTGCTVHFVEVEVDAGAIVEQAPVPVLVGDTVATLQERIKQQEHVIFPKAMEAVASGRVRLCDKSVVRSE